MEPIFIEMTENRLDTMYVSSTIIKDNGKLIRDYYRI